MIVNYFSQDLNDNPPLFGKQRYFTSVPEDLPPGSSVLRVSADDADSGRNARVTYSINRRQSDRDGVFRIDASTGLLVLENHLSGRRMHKSDKEDVTTRAFDVRSRQKRVRWIAFLKAH